MFWRFPITPVRWRVQSPNSDQSLHSLHLRLCKGQPRTQCSLRVPWGVVWFILWLSVPGNERTATNHCVTPNHSRERESKAHLHTTCTLSLPSAQCLPNTLRFWVFFAIFPLLPVLYLCLLKSARLAMASLPTQSAHAFFLSDNGQTFLCS